MRALETQDFFVASRSAAGNRRQSSRRIAAVFGVVAMILTASTASGQQGWSRPRSPGDSSAIVLPSASIETSDPRLGQRLEQFRTAVPNTSEAGSRRSDPARVVPPSFLPQKNADFSGRSDSDLSLQHIEGPAAIQPASLQSPVSPAHDAQSRADAQSWAIQAKHELTASSAALRSTPDATSLTQPAAPEIETTAVSVVPELFLDLTQDTPFTGDSAASKTSVHGGAEVSIDSSPTQVLMRALAWIVIVLCLFSLTMLGLRRWQRQRGLLPTTNSRSRVLETLSLGPGRTVSLIELAGFRALVASDTGGIRSLVLAPVSFHDELMHVEESPRQHVPAPVSS